nr:MAG TPA: hypothetical protein [Caudoviricetes sp.]
MILILETKQSLVFNPPLVFGLVVGFYTYLIVYNTFL